MCLRNEVLKITVISAESNYCLGWSHIFPLKTAKGIIMPQESPSRCLKTNFTER